MGTADAAIVSLSNEASWITEILKSNNFRAGENLNLMDKVLVNETNRLIASCGEAFAAMQFREGLQRGWFEMLLARNEYRSYCQASGMPMHKAIVQKWCENIIIMICPICPHWSEMMWKQIGKDGFAVKALWP